MGINPNLSEDISDLEKWVSARGDVRSFDMRYMSFRVDGTPEMIGVKVDFNEEVDNRARDYFGFDLVNTLKGYDFVNKGKGKPLGKNSRIYLFKYAGKGLEDAREAA